MKQEAQSYENILKALNKTSDQALFLTDMLRGNWNDWLPLRPGSYHKDSGFSGND